MSIKYYANRVQETSTSVGVGNFVLSGAPLGFRPFISAIGANNTFNYYIYRQDTNFEWEIGVGYIASSGGVNQLVRQRIVASSNGNNLVGFTAGTKYIETVVSQDRVNSSFINVEEKTGNFTAPYMPATYIVDASVSNIQVSLPPVTTQNDPITIGFVLNKTIGNIYEQINAIRLIPNGTETIAGTTEVDVSILNDYLQIVSVPSQSGWLLLDPIQDSTNPYGNDGTIQFKSNSAFSGVDQFTWDPSNKLLIGSSGLSTADIILPASSGQTTIFNQNLVDNDLRIAGSGNSHLLFVDGGLNRVAINSSVVPDTLSVNASSGDGVTVSRSGVGPRILLSNTSPSGITSNNVVGSIVFSGLSSSGNSVRYGSIKSVIDNNTDNAENSSINIETVNNGAVEEIAVFSPSGITLGSNSQNFDGIVLGAGSNNEGNNIVAGYFNSVCGENCVVLGDNSTVSSGTFGGTIGSNHSISGINMWILGGSGVSATGSHKTILALNDENYLEIQNSGYIKYVTLTDQDSTFSIDNISILTSGVDQNLSFTFLNSSGVTKTGLLITSSISDVSNNSEDSSFVAKVLSSGATTSILTLNSQKVVVGENSVSGNNIVFGLDNIISDTNNVIFGKDISGTGLNNILIGNNIALATSGTGITIIGKDNQCLSSGNLGVVIVGNGNQSDEDYSMSIGIDNANSGLYTVSCGYLNGVHGDYSVGVGESNLITSNYSVAIGRNNNLSTSDLYGSIFAMGVGNTGTVSNTGILVGYLNTINGSGGLIFGSSCSSSGNNNFILGDNSVVSGVSSVAIGINSQISGINSIGIGEGNLITSNHSAAIGKNNNFSTSNLNSSVFAIGVDNSGSISQSGLLIGYSNTISGFGGTILGSSCSISGLNNLAIGKNVNISGTGNIVIGNNRSISNSGVIDISYDDNNGLSVTSSGLFLKSSVSFVFNKPIVVNSGLTLNSLALADYSSDTKNLVLQNGDVRYENIVETGIIPPGETGVLTMSSAKYQVINPSGSVYLEFPNGSGLPGGKEFVIINADPSSYYIYLRRSGRTTNEFTVYNNNNISFIHVGNDKWIRINYNNGDGSQVINGDAFNDGSL
jgi:hypothetical protein